MDADFALAASLADDLDGAFRTLVTTHQDRLYTIALRLLGDHRDAEEVAQDAFVRAYRAMAGYDADRIRDLRLRPWLASIVVNLARNRRRRLDERTPPLQLEPIVEAGGEPPGHDERASPHDRAARRETIRTLAAALLALPPGPRAAVVLRHVDGLSVAETAVALDRPEGTVKAQVSRGLAQLRTHLAAEPDLGRPTDAGRPEAALAHRRELTA
ncbi:MAG TPA: RNA polymerase sigma factor [Candidatus Limnocylindrales bacterium]|nr:RNA polymerase sigma factor [Candidatus Limnocylindrales bacterium]